MDAPPDKEDCGPFLKVAAYLHAMHLNATQVLEANLEDGFLLLTDLGSTQYLHALTENVRQGDLLYAQAMDALLTMQMNGEEFCSELPQYDRALLQSELSLFADWLCGAHLNIEFAAQELRDWHASCDVLVDNALEQPVVFVHRDYHSRNLMVVDINGPGVLDFQDAVAGPYTYDLVSLLKDCYIAWPQEKVLNWARSFYRLRRAQFGSEIEEDVFIRHFELMGVQRQLKAAGIFARLNHRDGKPGYMRDIPRTLNYIVEIAARYPELTFLSKLISSRIVPALKDTAA